MYVIPKGVRHCTRAAQECQAMLIEPCGVVNTGDANSELSAPNDVWI
jgi:mannose-6-phosphate isomerase-like protein (cupin superfamily)